MNVEGRSPQEQGYRRPVEPEITDVEDPNMIAALLKVWIKLQALEDSVEGQDLVEYGLLVSLIALVCISSISKVAMGVNAAFSNISSTLA